MITLNNSNIDFDINNQILGSKYSISLSRNTSNFIFKTNDVERMTIMNNGNVGIGKTTTSYKLDIDGIVNASTFYMNGIEIPTYISNTSNYIGTTSNFFIDSIGNTSNYIGLTSNILIYNIRDTSNYVGMTSNIFIDRINYTTNYVGTTSNILVSYIRDTSNYVGTTSNLFTSNISDTSNYVGTTSNILVGYIRDTSNYVGTTSNLFTSNISDTSNYVGMTRNILIGRISDTSNYVGTTSNILVSRISDTSNYVGTTSNILIGRINNTSNLIQSTSNLFTSNISDTSNYVGMTSNILIGRISDTSNYVGMTSNILIGRISDTSNYVGTTSNILIGRINNTSNLIQSTSNFFTIIISDTSNYVGTTSNILVSRISETSNYVGTISNILVGRISDTSNYVRTTSNILIGRINDTSNLIQSTSNFFTIIISDTSNYVRTTSNILIGRISDTSNYMQRTNNILVGRISDTSNYIGTTSNILIGRINDTSNLIQLASNLFINNRMDTSNYVGTTSNILVSRISDTSNYVGTTHNILIGHINNTSNYVGTTSNILIGRINITSNLIQLASNLFINNISDTSNYVGMTCNILIGRISDTSNYMQRTNNILVETINNIANKWISSNNNIYFNTSNVGIGTYNPTSKLHLYDNINLNTEAIIQNNFQKSNVQNNVELISSTNLIPTISGNITGSTTDKYMIFKDVNVEYIMTVLSNDISCDILMIGGGGLGLRYGGGGAGACIVAINKIFQANTRFIVTVGSGGFLDRDADVETSTRGGSSTIKNAITNAIMYRAIGGGNGSVYGDTRQSGGREGSYYRHGGCGGGGRDGGYLPGIALSDNVVDGTSNIGPGVRPTYAVYGNDGAADVPLVYGAGGGGGGIGNVGAGETHSYTIIDKYGYGPTYGANISIGTGGYGGNGLYKSIINGITYNFKEYFANNNNFGVGVLENNITNYYIGGGGGGAGFESINIPAGGYGGGGSGVYAGRLAADGEDGYVARDGFTRIVIPPTPGTNNTGGGGGSEGWRYNGQTGVGGSGIVIIRYRAYTSSKSTIELVNGTRFDSNVDYSIGNYDGIFKILSSVNNSSQTERLVIKEKGNVGIGITVPEYPLHVGCIAINSVIEKYIQNRDNPWTQKTGSASSTVVTASAKFNGNIWVNECYINSDIRIKEDIQDINDDSALQKILSIEPKTYKYIDKVEKGYKKEYGFVAQQIQKVLPDAVILEKSYIPNIMTVADYNNKIITLLHKPINVFIKMKDKIKCFDSNNICIEIEVYKIINELTFEIKDLDKEFANNKIFVYGTHIDDFQILSKNHIFTLNVGATQELYRQIKEQEDIINSQEERMNILEKKNAILNQNFENLLLEIDLINKHFY